MLLKPVTTDLCNCKNSDLITTKWQHKRVLWTTDPPRSQTCATRSKRSFACSMLRPSSPA